MNREEIIAMAEEANCHANTRYIPWLGPEQLNVEWQIARDEKFAALVAAKERDECILEINMHTPRDGHDSPGWVRMNRMIAAIRARGQQ